MDATPRSPGTGRAAGPVGRHRPASRAEMARRELMVGSGMLAGVAAVGAYLAFRPASMSVDRWILDLVGPSRGAAFVDVTYLRYPQVVVAGSVIAAAVAFPTDRLRSLACLVGPPLALVTCELVAKPLVGRHLGGGLSYPSGSSAGAAALATVAVLTVPGRGRPVALGLGAAYAAWMSVAVIVLQWHYPTDAMAGAAWGVGTVLVADGGARRAAAGLQAWSSSRRPVWSRRG